MTARLMGADGCQRRAGSVTVVLAVIVFDIISQNILKKLYFYDIIIAGAGGGT